VITPEINLVFKDKIYRLGIGAIKSYITKDDTKLWGDTCFQVCTGLEIPLFSSVSIDLYGYYVFDDWGKIQEFADNSFEYSASLGVRF
jgi:hypothetical protein